MKTAHDIIKAAGGRQAVAEKLGVVVGQVSNRASEGKLPAAWFDGLERMVGSPLPRDLFSFKAAEAGKPRLAE